jgi:hypothetical protein
MQLLAGRPCPFFGYAVQFARKFHQFARGHFSASLLGRVSPITRLMRVTTHPFSCSGPQVNLGSRYLLSNKAHSVLSTPPFPEVGMGRMVGRVSFLL